MDYKELRTLGDKLLSLKAPLNSLWQEIGDNFYPERAIFTLQRSLGTDFASNLLTSYPILCRRDLGNQFGSMLRPVAKTWFHLARRHIKEEDNETKQWLQAFEETQRRAMYDPKSLFTRATKEGDHDFAAFGQCAISVELNRKGDTLLYRCWHLKDMAWQENEDGGIGFKTRKWKADARTLARTFGKEKLHSNIVKMLDTDPFTQFNTMHIVCESDMYSDKAGGKPWWSIWIDWDHNTLISATPIWTEYYVIPRWQTVSNVQYSYSPATVAALPDARLIQAMTWTLLEAGERATWPPMVATIDAVKSDIGNYAGGITWVDPEYDERLGEALRPLQQDFRGFQFGTAMNEDCRKLIYKAFFLDTLNMPQRGPEMTAYEVGQRVQQYIRDALPIFEPLEMDYNAKLCDMTFELLWRNGAFGSPLSWPKKLRGADIEFRFESPLHDAIEQQKGQTLMQGEGLMAAAMKVDPSVANIVDAKVALRDALNGIGVPARWMRNESDVQALDNQQQQEAQLAKVLAATQQGAAAAKDFGAANQSFAQAQPAAA